MRLSASKIFFFSSLFAMPMVVQVCDAQTARVYSNDSLVESELRNNEAVTPMLMNYENLLGVIQQHDKVIQQAVNEITVFEKRLLEKKRLMEETGRTPVTFVQEFMHSTEALPEEVRNLMDQKPDFQIARDLPEKWKDNPVVQELQKFTNTAVLMSSDFIADLDAYTQASLDLAMLIGLNNVYKEIALARSSNVAADILNDPRYTQSFRDMEAEKTKYLENKFQYGQAKDTRRTTPYAKFFSLSTGLMRRLAPRQIEQATEVVKLSFMEKLANLSSTLRLIWHGGKLVMSVLMNLKPTKDGVSKISQGVNAAARIVSEKSGQVYNVIGRENIPSSQDDRDIYIIAPSHRDGLQDAVGIAHLGIDEMAFLAAPDNFIPSKVKLAGKVRDLSGLKSYLISRLTANLGIIVTGAGANPGALEKLQLVVAETGIRRFLIYPEGKLTDALGASGAMREKYFNTDGAIALLERLGFRVHLIPIVMPDNFSPLGLERSSPKEFEMEILPTVSHFARKRLTAFGGHVALSNLFRYGLVDKLRSNDTLIWGQVRASKLPETLKEFADRRMNRGQTLMCRKALAG